MTAAIVPVKRLAAAKSRLARVLGRAGAETLALAMLADVLAALRGVAALEVVAVVTPDAVVGEAAERAGARALVGPDPGLNESIDRAAHELGPAADTTLVVLGDVAGARSEDLAALLAALGPAPAAALAPARDGGTTALARRPHGAIASRFGPDSARAHREAARAAGVRLVERRLPSLAIDLDDEAALRAFLATPEGGGRTRAALCALGIVAGAEGVPP